MLIGVFQMIWTLRAPSYKVNVFHSESKIAAYGISTNRKIWMTSLLICFTGFSWLSSHQKKSLWESVCIPSTGASILQQASSDIEDPLCIVERVDQSCCYYTPLLTTFSWLSIWMLWKSWYNNQWFTYSLPYGTFLWFNHSSSECMDIGATSGRIYLQCTVQVQQRQKRGYPILGGPMYTCFGVFVLGQ